MSGTRKPYNSDEGYLASLKCKLGGWIVIYDRNMGFDCDADYRYIVMHRPSSLHVSIKSLPKAREIMKGVARAESIEDAIIFADILPNAMTLTEAKNIVGNRADWELKAMVRALSTMKPLNDAEENERLEAAKMILKSRKA